MSTKTTTEEKQTEVENFNVDSKHFSKIYKELSAPIPTEMLKADTSRGFALTSINPQYIIERLNTVCGVNGWRHQGTYERVDNGVIFKGTLILSYGNSGVVREAVGYAEVKRNVGDAYKGAKTDSLSKCAAGLGLGNDVFKGLVAPPTGKAVPKKSTLKSVKKTSNSDF